MVGGLVLIPAYFVLLLQAAQTRCDLLFALALLCAGTAFLLMLQGSIPRGLFYGIAAVLSAALVGVAVIAGVCYLDFGRHVTEYGFAAVEATMVWLFSLLCMRTETSEEEEETSTA